MADGSKTDIVMMLWLNNRPLEAECGLSIAPNDPLMTDFKNNPGHFFELTDFDFNLKLDGADKTAEDQEGSPSAAAGMDFSRWYQYGPRDPAKTVYPVKFSSGGFERGIDCASPAIFQCCCEKTAFNKAIIVKRLSTGDDAGGPAHPTGYLKLEFRDVLITSVSWSDGEMVVEKCEFDCQEVTATYRKQAVHGAIGADGESKAMWKAPVLARKPL